MSRRTVRAIRADDGRLELLEPVDLPRHLEITVTLEIADEPQSGVVRELPTRKLGVPKVPITRDVIYADLDR